MIYWGDKSWIVKAIKKTWTSFTKFITLSKTHQPIVIHNSQLLINDNTNRIVSWEYNIIQLNLFSQWIYQIDKNDCRKRQTECSYVFL